MAVGRLLQSQVGSWRQMSAFSQNRDELVLSFAQLKGARFSLRIACRGDVQYINPTDSFRKSKSNVVELFEPINGVILEAVQVAALDRLLVLQFENGYALALKLHGNRSNVLLMQGGEVEALFKTEHENDWAHTNPPLYAVNSDWRNLLHPVQAALQKLTWQGDEVVQAAIATHPALKPLRSSMLQLEGGFSNAWDATQAAATLATAPPYGIAKAGERPAFFLHANDEREAIDHLDDALSIFVGRWWLQQRAGDLRKRIEQAFAEQRKLWEGRLHSGETGLIALEHQRPPEELGHILMANLHRMQTGMARIEVEDYYNDSQPLTIKLKPKLSPQANAERFYDKQKAVKTKRQHLQEMQSTAREKLAELDTLEDQYAELRRVRDLERFLKRHPQLLGKKQRQKQDAPAEPFWRFEVKGYEILVGKNAKKNDRLTFGYGRKNDFWLHAKDVAGSHVILRAGRDETPPLDVLEYAAGLAAWYSKLRNATLVPVIYTRRKYVRKPGKGAPAGLVTVQKEDVIMIEPVRPQT